MILCIRTDSPDAYLGLYFDGVEKSSKSWVSGRELSVQILTNIKSLCAEADLEIDELEGIVVYKGPGSYTGLRIGISVANAIGYSQEIAVVGESSDGWRSRGIEKLKVSDVFEPVSPDYGGEVRTTKPRK